MTTKKTIEKSVKKTYASQIRASQKYMDKFYVLRTRVPLEYEQVLKDLAHDRGISLNQMMVELIEREFITPANSTKRG